MSGNTRRLNQNQYIGLQEDLPDSHQEGSLYGAYDSEELYMYNEAGLPILVGSNAWSGSGGIPNTRVFAPSTDVSAAVSGAPTYTEIKTWNDALPSSHADTVIYYTGTDTSTDIITYSFHVDIAGNVTPVGNYYVASGLEAVNEGNGIGYRIIGRNPDNYGNIGKDAYSFSISNSASSTRGSTATRGIDFGINVTNPYADTLMLGSAVTGASTNGYSGYNIIIGENTNSYNNIYNSYLGTFRSEIGTAGASLSSAVVYQALAVGDRLTMPAARDTGMVGRALIGGSGGTFICGVANEDETLNVANYLTADLDKANPRFVVGCGTWNVVSNTGVRKTGFLIMNDGTVTAPLQTNSIINAAGNRALITKEYGDANYGVITPSDAVFKILDDSDPTKIINFQASAITGGVTRTITMADANINLNDILVNNAKVTNATHTGDVAGATALTAQPALITGKGAITKDVTDYLLVSDTNDAGNLKKMLISSLEHEGYNETGTVAGNDLIVEIGDNTDLAHFNIDAATKLTKYGEQSSGFTGIVFDATTNSIYSGFDTVGLGTFTAPAGTMSITYGVSGAGETMSNAGNQNIVVGRGIQVTGQGAYSGVFGNHVGKTVNSSSVLIGGQYQDVPNTTAQGSFGVGRRNTLYGTAGACIGVDLEHQSFGEVVVGVGATTYAANDVTGWNINDRAFVVGTGTFNISDEVDVRKDGLIVWKTGQVDVPTGSLIINAGDLGATGTRVTKGWFTDLEVTNAIAGSITGNAATVSTITGLAPDTATTAAAQPNITSVGTLTTLTVDDITINGNAITSGGASTMDISPLAGQALTLDGTINIDAGVVTGATSITSTTFIGDLTGNADTVTTNANLTGDVTSVGNATTISAKAVDVAMLADGTDGELITWDASGVATTIGTGASGSILTAKGAGSVPNWEEKRETLTYTIDLNGVASAQYTWIGEERTEAAGQTGDYATDFGVNNQHLTLNVNSVTGSGDVTITGVSMSESSGIPTAATTETITVDATGLYQSDKKWLEVTNIDIPAGISAINYDIGVLGYLDLQNRDFTIEAMRVDMVSGGVNAECGIHMIKIQDDGSKKCSLVDIEKYGIDAASNDVVDELRTAGNDRSYTAISTLWANGENFCLKQNDYSTFFSGDENIIEGSTKSEGILFHVNGVSGGNINNCEMLTLTLEITYQS